MVLRVASHSELRGSRGGLAQLSKQQRASDISCKPQRALPGSCERLDANWIPAGRYGLLLPWMWSQLGAGSGNAQETQRGRRLLRWGGSGVRGERGDEVFHGNGEAGQSRCGQDHQDEKLRGEGAKPTLQAKPHFLQETQRIMALVLSQLTAFIR